jgi:hypothetical protein
VQAKEKMKVYRTNMQVVFFCFTCFVVIVFVSFLVSPQRKVRRKQARQYVDTTFFFPFSTFLSLFLSLLHTMKME